MFFFYEKQKISFTAKFFLKKFHFVCEHCVYKMLFHILNMLRFVAYCIYSVLEMTRFPNFQIIVLTAINNNEKIVSEKNQC